MQKKEKSKIRRLDMSTFAPPKAKRPAKLWTPLPSTKSVETSTTTTTNIAGPRVVDTTTTMASTCGTCKRRGLPALFVPSLLCIPHLYNLTSLMRTGMGKTKNKRGAEKETRTTNQTERRRPA